MVSQAACLVEGSNQHHYYYYHRRGAVRIVSVVFFLVCVCGELVWDYACRPGEKMKTLAVLGCTAVTQAALAGERGTCHCHRRTGHDSFSFSSCSYYYSYFRDS